MSATINEAHTDGEMHPSDRQFTIEADNPHRANRGAVFIMGPMGLCMEFDRAQFLAAIKAEFGLIDPLEELFAVS